jgi:hypothetical protein
MEPRRTEPHDQTMSNRHGDKPESRAEGSWHTGRLSRRRTTRDALRGEHEGVAKPEDAEPNVVEEFLPERVGLLDVLFDGQGDD